MFLRKKRKKSGGEVYEYWSLCETVRTAKGPRQRVVASLCKLDEEEVRGGGWDDIEGLLSGKPVARAFQPQLGEVWQSPPARWEKVDVGAVSVERVREFGEVYLPLALWHRLGLGKLLKELIEPGREKVGWETVASVLVAARFCAQRSELGVAEGWYEKTALEDLLGVDKARINDDRLYRALDVLGRHKEKLCSHLEAGQRAHHRQGAYLLRTNCEETDPATLWRWYIQLISAEAAFRTAKSDLGLRPIFHHLESRVDAHILVCFLALALWRTLEQWMHAKGLGSCARKLID